MEIKVSIDVNQGTSNCRKELFVGGVERDESRSSKEGVLERLGSSSLLNCESSFGSWFPLVCVQGRRVTDSSFNTDREM